MKQIYILFLVMIYSCCAFAQISMINTGSYSQDFNTLIATSSVTWADNSTLASWYAQRSGTGTSIAANAGSSATGNLYSYGTGSNTERALGSIGSGTAGNFAWGLLLRNMSGGVITDIKISYTGEQWRNSAAAAAQTLSFYYKISSAEITSLNPNDNSTWTSIPALDFTSPVTGGSAAAIDGNAVGNRSSFNEVAIPSLTLNNGDYIMLKWDDPDHSGSDHGLSIDDVTVSWTGAAAGSLPVKFQSLDASTSNNSVALNWKVAAEENITGYDVERSFNGRGFSKIGFVAASGKTNYSFVDSKSSSITYYRIKSVDLNGKYGYSTVALVKAGKSMILLQAVPSLFVKDFKVRHSTASAGSLIVVSSEDGRTVKSVVPAVGTQETPVDLSFAKAGIYLVRYMSGNGEVETLKVVKQQ